MSSSLLSQSSASERLLVKAGFFPGLLSKVFLVKALATEAFLGTGETTATSSYKHDLHENAGKLLFPSSSQMSSIYDQDDNEQNVLAEHRYQELNV